MSVKLNIRVLVMKCVLNNFFARAVARALLFVNAVNDAMCKMFKSV